jgi:hypothetical protein
MGWLVDIVLGSITRGVNVRAASLITKLCSVKKSHARRPSQCCPSLTSRLLQKPTLFLFNLASIGCALTFGALVFTDGTPPELLPHLAVLLLSAVGLVASVNW